MLHVGNPVIMEQTLRCDFRPLCACSAWILSASITANRKQRMLRRHYTRLCCCVYVLPSALACRVVTRYQGSTIFHLLNRINVLCKRNKEQIWIGLQKIIKSYVYMFTTKLSIDKVRDSCFRFLSVVLSNSILNASPISTHNALILLAAPPSQSFMLLGCDR